ncbi:MAG: hypothetical protein ABJA67_01150 [Chthonomonadales bacterium]
MSGIRRFGDLRMIIIVLAVMSLCNACARSFADDTFGPPSQTSTVKTVKVDEPKPAVITVAVAEDPLEWLEFKGLVDLNNDSFALLEDSLTGDGIFVKVGDIIQGATITSFDTDSVNYRCEVGDLKLPMNTNYSLVPLSRDAKFLEKKESNSNTTPSVKRSAAKGKASKTPAMTEERAQNLEDRMFEGKISHKKAAQKGLRASTIKQPKPAK